ncbi:MAG: polysaccharide biosynthesis protein, partial [Casimicrobiaceae bacterium]
LDYGSGIMARFLAEAKPYDVVLNFAALKHVRSEKDTYSVLQMLDTNLVKHARFKTWLRDYGHVARYFAVSTDKAANPSSIMGASKRLMEDVAFDFSPAGNGSCTSARFANVAFSNGSLLQSFLTRLEKRQPLAAPRGTRRYFVARREAGEICVLAAATVPDRHIAIPTLDPATHLQPLDEIATTVLAHFGYRAVAYDEEAAAIRDLETLAARGEWPLVVTPLDTSGEKPYEEFTGDGESAIPIGLTALRGIWHADNPLIDENFIATLGRLIEEWNTPVSKRDLAALLSSMLPTFCHVETGKNLDQRV